MHVPCNDPARLLRVQEAPGLLQTIEDFMWFKLALVRPSRGETATSSGYFASGAPPNPILQTHSSHNTALYDAHNPHRLAAPSLVSRQEVAL